MKAKIDVVVYCRASGRELGKVKRTPTAVHGFDWVVYKGHNYPVFRNLNTQENYIRAHIDESS